jgi:nicotinamidase-related amidase
MKFSRLWSTMTLVARGSVGRLRPEHTAFLLCDIQERFKSLIYNGPTVIRTSQYLTSVAKALDIPIVATQHATKVFGPTVSDCFATPEDLSNTPVFEKKVFSMLCGPEMDAHLEKLQRNTYVLFGVEAHICVQQTALDLLERGNEVHIVVDAVSSQLPYDRTIALQRLQQAGAWLTTAQSAAFMLMQTADHPNFKTVSRLTVDHMKLSNGLQTFE